MQQEKKRNRTCFKYHYETVKICVETDVIYTRCRECKQLKPSNLEYFRKDSDPHAQRLILPLCKECWREIDKQKRDSEKMKKIHAEKPINYVEQKELFDWKVFTKEESESNDTLESKVDRILSFLWLNKWTYKK